MPKSSFVGTITEIEDDKKWAFEIAVQSGRVHIESEICYRNRASARRAGRKLAQEYAITLSESTE